MDDNFYPPEFFDNEQHKSEDPEERERVQSRADSMRRQFIKIVGEATVDLLMCKVNGPSDGSDATIARELKKDRSTIFRWRKAAYSKIRRNFRF